MEVECVYENGVLKPLKPVKLKEGEKVRISIKFRGGKRRKEVKDILKKYAGIIKLKKKVRLKDILDLGDDVWLH